RQSFQRRFRIGHPAKGQGLHKSRSRQLGSTLHETAVASRRLRRAGQDNLHGLSNIRHYSRPKKPSLTEHVRSYRYESTRVHHRDFLSLMRMATAEIAAKDT